MKRSDNVILRKIYSEVNVAFSMLGNTSLKEFLKDEKLKRATAMTLINIGELVKALPLETRHKYPDVEWKPIAGMRDIAAHQYQTLRMEDVYNTLTMDLPKLKDQLENIIDNRKFVSRSELEILQNSGIPFFKPKKEANSDKICIKYKLKYDNKIKQILCSLNKMKL